MISRENYEIYFIDFFEGNLSEKDVDMLNSFLDSNIDLKIEFENFQNISLVEEDNSTTIKVYHARDRSNVDYATSSILAQLSIDDCTDEMIQQICKLYHVDVELMKWLGFSNNERGCDMEVLSG